MKARSSHEESGDLGGMVKSFELMNSVLSMKKIEDYYVSDT